MDNNKLLSSNYDNTFKKNKKNVIFENNYKEFKTKNFNLKNITSKLLNNNND